jgi:hypothetical protein
VSSLLLPYLAARANEIREWRLARLMRCLPPPCRFFLVRALARPGVRTPAAVSTDRANAVRPSHRSRVATAAAAAAAASGGGTSLQPVRPAPDPPPRPRALPRPKFRADLFFCRGRFPRGAHTPTRNLRSVFLELISQRRRL